MADSSRESVEHFITRWRGVTASADDIVARFTSKGPWKKRLPQLLEILVILGRA